MAEHRVKSFAKPDEVLEFPNVRVRVVELGDITVGHFVNEPGWSWHDCIRPTVGGEWCQARHLGMVISGRLGVEMEDGTRFEVGPDEVFDIPPGHNGWTVGDEPVVQVEWAGIRAFAGFPTGIHSRILVTLLFTDVVGSTALAAKLGDARWRELLSKHYESARAELERYRGREVDTTGDGLLATFAAPAPALHCAAAVQKAARAEGLRIRAGVHVGEVETVGRGVRGVAVHEAARIMGEAAGDEILVSEATRLFAGPDLAFEDRGVHTLKGLDGEWRLSAFVQQRERA
ncbi:MAG TPA: adenylate/guanylate cyclase domain-containing protein [Gaiellaceae bacterium]|nr:adenylate/guanylate cyclase domain-containing protein [Gaiellaceae bacterium]